MHREGCFVLISVFLDILSNEFVGDSTHTGTEIPTCPEVLSPVALLETGELLLQEAGGTSLEVLGDLGRADGGWAAYEKMDMIFGHYSLDDGPSPGLTRYG